MRTFSFLRFVRLLSRVLEIATIAALLFRWLALFVAVRYRSEIAGSAIDVAANFAFLAILLLLLNALWLLLTRQARSVSVALRTLAYVVFWILGPLRLGGLQARIAQRPNRAMELTASRRDNRFFVTFVSLSAATRALARRSSSWSR